MTTRTLDRCAIAWLACGLAASGAAALQPTTRASSFDRTFTVSPAPAEDRAPLQERPAVFAFSQEALELRHENAATLYLMAIPQLPGRGDEEWGKRFEEFGDKPIHELDPVQARQVLHHPQGAAWLQITEPAIRRTYADWGAPLEEQGVVTLLPYLNETRQMARLLALEARLLAREGKHDESADMLRRVFVLAGHLGNAQQPVLVDGLVGVGVAALGLERVREISQLEGTPNRYWALTTLPTPMFDAPRWFQNERLWITVSLPELREPESMTAGRWRKLMARLRTFGDSPALPPAGEPENPVLEAALMVVQAVQAAEFLKSRGYTQEQIEQQGLYPMLARLILDDYMGRMDAVTRLLHLPFPDAHPRMESLEKDLQEEVGSLGSVLATVAMPSLVRANEATWRMERQMAALRIVEAIRDHAAAHDGALPARLEDMRLPIPQDPMTGRHFGYAVEADTFTLTAERYSSADVHSGFVWRVTMRRP